MLVLNRKQNESIQINAEIQVTVIAITKGRVKLGIQAPNHIRIVRGELRLHNTKDASNCKKSEPQALNS